MSSTKFRLKAVVAPTNGVAPEGMVIMKVGAKSVMVTKEHYEEYKAHQANSKPEGPESKKKNQGPSAVQKTPNLQAPNQDSKPKLQRKDEKPSKNGSKKKNQELPPIQSRPHLRAPNPNQFSVFNSNPHGRSYHQRNADDDVADLVTDMFIGTVYRI